MIEVGIAARALEPGGPSGDQAVVVEQDRLVLVAAIDGLGHGEQAAAAAETAAGVLRASPALPFDELFARCHQALLRTRGAVMTAVRFGADGTLAWAGVGNVEARLVRQGGAPGHGGSPVLIGGVLGHQPKPPRESTVALERGDVVVLATDGVRADFSGALSVAGPAQAVAERVLERAGLEHDDALVVVVRWLGRAPT